MKMFRLNHLLSVYNHLTGIASELMQGQQLILTFCVTEQES